MTSPVRHMLLGLAMTGLVACSRSGTGLEGGLDSTAPAQQASPVAEAGSPGRQPVEIFAGADWYLARTEPEEEWRGVLHEREVERGPATRSALRYSLQTEDQDLAVYVPSEEAKLSPFLGREVVVTAKLVDLTDEGFGQELWIGSIRLDPP